jgi:hypothetical protein
MAELQSFDDIKESGLIDKRAAALGPIVREPCDPVLEQAYRRLWLGLEIICWNQPTGLTGWFLKKAGVLTRSDGLDLLGKPVNPEYVQRLWDKHGPKSKDSPFFYWRTALIGQYLRARNFCFLPVRQHKLRWLYEQDPLLSDFLSNFGRVIQSGPGNEDLLALGYHYNLECWHGEPISLGDVLLEFNIKPLLDYMNFPDTGSFIVREMTIEERANARGN